MQLFDRTADELAARDTDLAIIPIGSIEQHGPHLPLSTDYRIAAAFGEAVAEAAGGFSIPPLPVSTCREHMGKKGAVWIFDSFFHPDTAPCIVFCPIIGGIYLFFPQNLPGNLFSSETFLKPPGREILLVIIFAH